MSGLKKLFSVKSRKAAFTLAEVLITLAVIGIVVSLILPNYIADVKARRYAAARGKMLNTVGEAIRQIAVQGNINEASDAQDFVENYLKTQLQIVKTCDNQHLKDCGLTEKIYTLNKKARQMPKTMKELVSSYMLTQSGILDSSSKSYGFVMSNGYVVNLFYNSNCMVGDRISSYNTQDRVCVNVIYDMNGLALPNQFGKDVGFVTIMYPDMQSVAVAPNVYELNVITALNFENAKVACSTLGKDYSLPTIEELSAMAFNGTYIDNLPSNGLGYWSSSEVTGGAWRLAWAHGVRHINKSSSSNNALCIKR